MKPLCINRHILFLLILLHTLLFAAPKSALVYYGDDLSWPLAGSHDYIIVQPEHINTNTHGFRTYRKQVYAYVSVGEAENDDAIEPTWVLGKNKLWNSRVMDLSNPAYRAYLLKRIQTLRDRGFANFFFDTLDSFSLIKGDADFTRLQHEGLLTLLRRVHQQFPGAKLILNRGFDLLPETRAFVSAVLLESYYRGLNQKLGYSAVTNKERQWLDKQLAYAKKEKIDIIVVDYMDELHSEAARKLVKKLQDKGFIPYVGDRHLLRYGDTSKQSVKREVLMLYDGKAYPAHYQGAHQLGSLPLEYMGYVPVLKDFNVFKLPEHPEDRYAGIIFWSFDPLREPTAFYRWIQQAKTHGVYTLFFESFGTENPASDLQILDIHTQRSTSTLDDSKPILYKDSMMGYEILPHIQNHDLLLQPRFADPLLTYEDKNGPSTLAAVTEWGGYAVQEASIVEVGEDNLWVADPFKLYRKTLRLPPIPVPDPTTENGRRLLFTHIDGDGIMNRAEWAPDRFSGEVIRDEILKKYPLPHSVSIVEGETAPWGLYPKLSNQLESIAKSIYALDNVEAATHTFSHPFVWGAIDANGSLDPKYRLKVPDYTFSIDRDIGGSIDYINTRLLPPGKPRTKTIFWSGDCLPTERVLAYTYQQHFLNMNGGDTTITRDRPWLYNIAPFGIRKGDYYQIYTGAQNENVYTHEFHGPFWGFRKVIQTFEMTGSPRRFKPIDIYYHFYSGSKTASLKALKEVFDWASAQKTMPIYASEYIPKAMEFYDASIDKRDHGYGIHGLQALRTVRLDAIRFGIDQSRSRGIAGYLSNGDSLYVSLDGSDAVEIHTDRTEREVPHLHSANGRLSRVAAHRYRLKAHVPLEFEWYCPKDCCVTPVPKADRTTRNGDIVTFSYTHRQEAVIDAQCQ